MSVINIEAIMRTTPAATKSFVVRRYREADVLTAMAGYESIKHQYRQLLQHYRGPQTNRVRDVSDWLVANIETVRESMRRQELTIRLPVTLIALTLMLKTNAFNALKMKDNGYSTSLKRLNVKRRLKRLKTLRH